MTDGDALTLRVERVEAEIEKLRDFKHDHLNDLQRLELIQYQIGAQEKISETRHNELKVAIGSIADRLRNETEISIAKHVEFSGHIRECDTRRKWQMALWASAIVALISTGVQWFLKK